MTTVPHLCYIVCSTPRSGSNLLVEALRLTGVAGWPEEYFLYWFMLVYEPERHSEKAVRPWLLPPDAYVAKFFELGTRHGVFGAKSMGNHRPIAADNLRRVLRDPTLEDHQAFERVFPGLQYIYLTRRNKHAQAVSWAKAEQSGQWFKSRADGRSVLKRLRQKLAAPPLTYNFQQIALCYQKVLEQEREWEAYFRAAGVEPYRVVFEEFIKNYDSTALDILRHLGIEEQPGREVVGDRDLEPQYDATNAVWTKRFRAEWNDGRGAGDAETSCRTSQPSLRPPPSLASDSGGQDSSGRLELR